MSAITPIPKTPFQPTLPAEGIFTDAEVAFLEDSPPGLFPENQNSNFGLLIRKFFSDYIQQLIGQQNTIYNERFVDTALQFLDEWERQEDLPINPANATTAQRRNTVLSRVRKGPFTWARRAALLDNFVASSFGEAVALLPAGVPFDSSGIPLYSGVTSSIGTYRVYENIRNFSYQVWLKNTFTPGVTLTRELTRITPAGITFTIDNTHTDVLNYSNLVKNAVPLYYYPLGDLVDYSGNTGQNLTAQGGAVAGGVAAPGLLVGAAGAGNPASNFNGTTNYFSVTPSAQITQPAQFSVEGWFKINAWPASGAHRMIYSQNSRYLSVYTDASGNWIAFTLYVNGAQRYMYTPFSGALGTTHHAAGVYDGYTMSIYLDGVLKYRITPPAGAVGISSDASPIFIGAYNGPSNFMNGVIDEVAIYNYALDADTILDHYNTGLDIATY